jgi:hypothetical protein
MARIGHDFSRISVYSDPPISSPAQQRMDAGSHMAERVCASGVISTKTSLGPHEGSPATLRREADIYAQGKTPVRVGDQLAAWDAKPLGAPETAPHLREIQRRFGAEGLERTVHGLTHTRGEGFAHRAAERAGLSLAARSPQGGAIGRQTADAIRASNASGPLPDKVRHELTEASGHDFGRIAIHNDAVAHRVADQLNARAFTVGRRIYFARNEYQPSTAAGRHLLAHEAAHVVQQRGHDSPPNEHFSTTAGTGREEDEAVHFADFVAGSRGSTPPPLTPSTRTGLVRRAITFTHANDAFTTNPVTAAPNETAAGFQLRSNPGPSFQWDTDVTIHGKAGDPFGNFQVGFLQVERVFDIDVYWGTGANRTHRTVRPDHLPRRDAATEASIFASDSAPYVRPAFAADGDVRSPSFHDTPQTQRFPWDNPIAGRTGTRGWFTYEDAFVTYLSARDTTAGTDAKAFRDLANVWWNLSAGGQFDTTKPVGSRVNLSAPGKVNHSGVIQGGSAQFPAIHGGTIANGHDITTDK